MKYHHQQGIIEKDKKGHPKIWTGLFVCLIFIAYGGFLFGVTALNGWPLASYDQTAQIVKTTKPGQLGDRLYIPSLNVAIKETQAQLKGDPKESQQVTITGSEFALAVTPSAVREASPFFNLDRLREGDQVFLDKDSVRYAYKITSSPDKDAATLKLENGKISRTAEAIGTVAWQGGQPKLQGL